MTTESGDAENDVGVSPAEICQFGNVITATSAGCHSARTAGAFLVLASARHLCGGFLHLLAAARGSFLVRGNRLGHPARDTLVTGLSFNHSQSSEMMFKKAEPMAPFVLRSAQPGMDGFLQSSYGAATKRGRPEWLETHNHPLFSGIHANRPTSHADRPARAVCGIGAPPNRRRTVTRPGVTHFVLAAANIQLATCGEAACQVLSPIGTVE